MTPPLKPCPFCGSAPRYVIRYGQHMISCEDMGCGALVSAYCYSADAAAEKWNRRAPSIEEGAARRHQEGRGN